MGEEKAISSPAPVTGATTAGPTKLESTETATAASHSPPVKGRLSSVDAIHTTLAPLYPFSTPASFSAVPFSWEEQPGVPKASSKPPASSPHSKAHSVADSSSPYQSAAPKLPLPPAPFRRGADGGAFLVRAKKRPGAGPSWLPDPFTAALVMCSLGNDDSGDQRLHRVDRPGGGEAAAGRAVPAADKVVGFWRKGRRWGVVGDRFGMSSCMPAAGAVMDSTVRVPRALPGAARRPLPPTAAAASSYGLPNARRAA